MRGSNEKMTRSSSVVTRHDRRGSCVVMTADGPASSLTAAEDMVLLALNRFFGVVNKNTLAFMIFINYTNLSSY